MELTASVTDMLILLMRSVRSFILSSVPRTGGAIGGTVGNAGTAVVLGTDIVTSAGSVKWAAFLVGAASVVNASSGATECAVECRSCLLSRRRSSISITS